MFNEEKNIEIIKMNDRDKMEWEMVEWENEMGKREN